MSADKFNSLGGYSVGIPPIPVIDANGNVITNVLVTSGNVTAANIYAANYYYANGRPFNAGGNPVGPNTSIQFNGNGQFDGSANLTFNNVTNLLTTSNFNVTGLSNLGPVSNITITGGGTGYLLSTDGNGALQWSPPGTGSAISNGNSNVVIANFNGNITAGVNGTANVVVIKSDGITVQGNTTTGNLKTDSILYANGSPYVFTTNAAGSNTQVQFNNNNSFSASANFTFDYNTNTLAVTNITGNGSGLTSINGANVTGQVANALVAGTVYTNDQPNITSVGNLTSLSVIGNIISGNANLGNAVTANFFIGSGNNLSNIQGANVSGTVENANIANVAYSVNVANVSGIGNIATINLDGNVSNLLTGNGTFVAIPTVSANANYANFAGQVTESNQANITSVGNLTDLTVGNLTSNVIIIDGNINATGNVTASN
jgi:hypothetical protein